MTASATQFITPLTFQALSGHPVQTQLLAAEQENSMGHINLARWADKIIIAPATANMIAKLAHGLADDLISSLCLAAQCSIYIAPAMNQAMWHNQVTQDNLKTVHHYGFHIIDPEEGSLACGEIGWGRMSDPSVICEQLTNDLPIATRYLKGIRLLISAGPTREPLDPVRYISNRSSGKMGYALAQAALNAGADVTLVSGPVALSAPIGVNLQRVETAQDMFQAIILTAPKQDIYIGTAAVSDYTAAVIQTQKIKKKPLNDDLNLSLKKTKDILAAVAQLSQRPFVVGFAAETQDVARYAKEKLVRKKCDLIAANWVGQAEGGFEDNRNALNVFWANGEHKFPMMAKKELAIQLMALIFERFKQKVILKA
jgi:phosphopantothenoylcysteine decarboxylase/phosphopantothenate--cysteine ligase